MRRFVSSRVGPAFTIAMWLWNCAAVAAAGTTASTTATPAATAPTPSRAPIVHTIRVPAPESQTIEIETRIPVEGRDVVELMMPVWTPGFYRVEDYAGNVEALIARTPDGQILTVEYPSPNHWRILTTGAPEIIVAYRLSCTGRSVTTNWVDEKFAVLNGAASFLTLVEPATHSRPHGVVLELPDSWPKAMTALAPWPGHGDATPSASASTSPSPSQAASWAHPDARRQAFLARDFDTLVDSPIVAGDLDIQTFQVAGKRHALVSAGERPEWDSARGAHDLARMIEESRRLWGVLPYDRYAFLLVFRKAGAGRIGGGLEHKDSTLVNVNAENILTPRGYASWLSLVTHEYVHAFNVKRLRPAGLGPFDYEKPPRTSSLWFSEGVTSYYAALLLARSGVTNQEEFLTSMSSAIGQLQKAPGRLLQTLEESSLDVWNNSLSGVNPSEKTVSYYVKGEVAGLLLDARIRRATNNKKSLDDVMRLAYKRYAGPRGFTPEQLRATASEVAGADLSNWFTHAIASTSELDYSELQELYGLRLSTAQAPDTWKLEMSEQVTPAQKARLQRLLASPSTGQKTTDRKGAKTSGESTPASRPSPDSPRRSTGSR